MAAAIVRIYTPRQSRPSLAAWLRLTPWDRMQVVMAFGSVHLCEDEATCSLCLDGHQSAMNHYGTVVMRQDGLLPVSRNDGPPRPPFPRTPTDLHSEGY